MAHRRFVLPIALALAAPPARADEPPPAPLPVDVVVDPCVAADRGQLLAILALELEGIPEDEPSPDADPGGAARKTRVEVSCLGAGPVQIRVLDRGSGRTLARALEIGRVQVKARPRLLALAVAELVTASRMEIEPAAPSPEPEGPPPAAPTPAPPPLAVAAADVGRPAPAPGARTRLGALAQARMVTEGGPLWGLGLRFGHDLRPRLGVGLDLVAERGSRSFLPGTVSMDAASAGAAVFYRQSAGEIAARLGGGLRGGAVRIAGRAAPVNATQVEQASFVAAWGGPIAVAVVSAQAGGPLMFEVALEAGYTVLGARGSAGDEGGIGLRGPWMTLSLAVGYGR